MAIRILVADSLKALLLAEKNFLMRAGFEVLTSESGKGALELARGSLPRLILLDLAMPDMDGSEACAAMRREPSLSQTPIIIMSPTDDPAIRDRCLKAGCTNFVVKPRKPEELLEVVARTLSVGERRALRVRVTFKVTVVLNDRQLPGKVTNLSATGLLLLSETTMPLGSLLGLQFTLPKAERPIKATGKVVRVGWNADQMCEAGVHFMELSEMDRKEILDFTSS